jgi:hypothetical protein
MSIRKMGTNTTLENCVTKATTTKRRKKGTNASKEGFEHLVFDEKEDISLLRYSVRLCILHSYLPNTLPQHALHAQHIEVIAYATDTAHISQHIWAKYR